MTESFLRKYFIMGSQNCSCNPVIVLEEAIEAGITAFQYREKGPGALIGQDKIHLGQKLRDVCLKYGIPFFINDDANLINTLKVDGIHVGQDDVHVSELRKQFPNLLIGLSISNETELKASSLEYVDYIGVGPIFSTATKIDAKEATGTKWISTLRDMYPNLPIVGIGGIDETNANHVMEAGANGVSVISAISEASNIKVVVDKL